MLDRLLRSSVALQVVLLSTCAFTVFMLQERIVFNAVMRNYYLGGHSFLHGFNPYEITLQNGPSNQFKYSPLFAMVMGGISQLGTGITVLGIWIFTGITVFFLGLRRWCDFSEKAPFYVTLALLASLTDLLTSMSAYQVNALITGLLFVGLASFRCGRFFSAGAILLIASNLKVYPVIFFIPLALTFRTRYWAGALSAGGVAFLLPALFVGWSHNLEMHFAWVRIVLENSVGGGVLDLVTAFQRIGLSHIGAMLRWVVLVISLPCFICYFPLVKHPDWRPWITFGLASLLLLSPRTEVFTYVLLAPSYVLMAFWCAESKRKNIRTYLGIFSTILAIMIASCRYTDPEWYVSENPFEIVRVIGALGLWGISLSILSIITFRSLKGRMAEMV